MALVLTTATQLRLGALPIGPGEILLLGWMFATGARLLLRRVWRRPGAVVPGLPRFWLVSAMLLTAGSVVALSDGVWTADNAAHDAAAFALAMSFSVLLATSEHIATAARAKRLAQTFFAVGTTSLLVLAVVAFTVPRLGVVDFWYSSRLRGWSENPNQFALLSVVTTQVGIILLLDAATFRRRLIVGISAAAAFAVGVLTSSDALVVAGVVTAPVASLMWWQLALRENKRPLGTTALVVLLPTVMVVAALAFGPAILATLRGKAELVYSEGNQGAVRFALWRHGLEAIRRSPVVGFGPGSHSGVSGPFEGSEAHNTFIDWGMSAGVVGMWLYVAMLWSLFRRSWRVRQLGPAVALVMIAVFSLFHYVLRHPVFWFLVLLVAALSRRAAYPTRSVSQKAGRHFPTRIST